MTKVSVVVPVYNVEKYLEECLDSIIAQTLQDIEIICVNDGSTDRSAEILDRYAQKDPRITVITQTNQGPSKARNIGIAQTKGEYIGFVDSDDIIAADFLEKLYIAAKKYDADVAMTNIRRYSIKHYKLKIKKEDVYIDAQAKINAAEIPHSNYIWNKIYRKSALKYPFAEGFYYEDVEWSIRIIYYANKLVTVPDTVYYCRRVKESIMHSPSEKKTNDFRWAKNELLKFAREHNLQFNEKYYMNEKTKVTLFGLTILKGYHWSYRSRYKLFGILPFMTIERWYSD
jgi:glycosyltransferase involved in cell wall biosynthesis